MTERLFQGKAYVGEKSALLKLFVLPDSNCKVNVLTHTKRNQAGFSLLETIVAFIVLVLVLGVMFQVFASGARSQRLANDYSEAVIVARSILNQAKHGVLAEQGSSDRQYRWQLMRTPYLSPELQKTPTERPFTAEKLTVIINWVSSDTPRQVELSSIHLLNNDE